MAPHFHSKQRKVRAKDLKLLEDNWGLARTQWELTYIYVKPAEQGIDSGTGSINSFSTNATMDNNVGTGRMLDKFYQYIGRKIVRVILNLRMRVELVPPNRILDRLLEKSQYETVYTLVNRDMDFVLEGIGKDKGRAAVSGVLSLLHQTR